MDNAVAALLDKQQITEGIYKYCRAVDRMDRALLVSIWADEADVDYGETYRGPAAGLVEVVWRIHGPLLGQSHQVTNILIELDGDRAASEAYFIAALRPPSADGASAQVNVRGRYLDRWVRADGAWLIAHRTVALDFSDVAVVGAGLTEPNGRNNDTDPSYGFFR